MISEVKGLGRRFCPKARSMGAPANKPENQIPSV